jgi:hypothetical protein
MSFTPIHFLQQLNDVDGDKIISINGILPSGVEPGAGILFNVTPELDTLIMSVCLPKAFTSTKGAIGYHSDMLKRGSMYKDQCLSHSRVAAFKSYIGEVRGTAPAVIAAATFKLPVKVATSKIRRECFPKQGAFYGFAVDLLVQHAPTNEKKRKTVQMLDFSDDDSSVDFA